VYPRLGSKACQKIMSRTQQQKQQNQQKRSRSKSPVKGGDKKRSSSRSRSPSRSLITTTEIKPVPDVINKNYDGKSKGFPDVIYGKLAELHIKRREALAVIKEAEVALALAKKKLSVLTGYTAAYNAIGWREPPKGPTSYCAPIPHPSPHNSYIEPYFRSHLGKRSTRMVLLCIGCEGRAFPRVWNHYRCSGHPRITFRWNSLPQLHCCI
jgi:hypothetical protein